MTETAGAAFVGLAAASPEVGISLTSAVREVGDIGLGASLGANIFSIPFVVTTAYIFSRGRLNKKKTDEKKESSNKNNSEENKETKSHQATENKGESDGFEHEQHRREGILRIKSDAVWVQALPYFLIVILFGILTIPSAWRGLQPTDGWILLAAYIVYLAQAIFRGRQSGEDVEWTKKGILLAVAGLVALAAGAYFIVRSTENIVAAFDISKIVGGLFITAPMATLPEIFAVRSIVKSGQITAATASTFGDNAVTMTLAFMPLAFIALPVENINLLSVNLVFISLMPLIFAALVHWNAPRHGFRLWSVLTIDAVVAVYLLIAYFTVL